MKMKILFIGVFLAVLVLGIVLTSFEKKQTTPSKTPIPTVSGSFPNNYYWTGESRDAAKRGYVVGDLIDRLPYNGENFIMNYDIDEDRFVVVLNSNNLALANKEFDAFLAENKIGDRSWIKNLVVKREALRL